jgi:hypothetical protein
LKQEVQGMKIDCEKLLIKDEESPKLEPVKIKEIKKSPSLDENNSNIFNDEVEQNFNIIIDSLEQEMNNMKNIKKNLIEFKKKMLTAYSCKNLVTNIGFNDPLYASNTIGYNRYKTNIFYFKNFNLNFPNFITQNKEIEKRFISRSNLFNRLITVIFKILKINNH